MDRESVIWAAGLFEGEGCISFSSPASRGLRPKANLTSTDEDVIRRFHATVGVGKVFGPYDQGHKPFWSWQVYTFEQTQAVIAMLWPWLGERRRARAREVILRCRSYVAKSRRRRETCGVPGCSRRHLARGMCNMHYLRDYRKVGS
jgi:hypothetical protein